jgi:hypothetical protein
MDCYIVLISIRATYHAPVLVASSSSQLVKPLGHLFKGHSLSYSLTHQALTQLFSQQSQALTHTHDPSEHSLSQLMLGDGH